MADDKKGAVGGAKKPEKPKGWNFSAVEGFIILLFLLLIVGSIVPSIFKYIGSGQISFFGLKFSGFGKFFSNHSTFFKALGLGIGAGAGVGTFVLNKMADAISHAEKLKLYPGSVANMLGNAGSSLGSSLSGASNAISNFGDKLVNGGSNFANKASSGLGAVGTNGGGGGGAGGVGVGTNQESVLTKWQQIVKHSESVNPSDWRLCIIEADIILEDLLGILQLPGITVGDKLKAVEKSDFLTIENAWEAHKVRNQIAHQGSNFLLNQREVRRIISLYESVFKEFHLI